MQYDGSQEFFVDLPRPQVTRSGTRGFEELSRVVWAIWGVQNAGGPLEMDVTLGFTAVSVKRINSRQIQAEWFDVFVGSDHVVDVYRDDQARELEARLALALGRVYSQQLGYFNRHPVMARFADTVRLFFRRGQVPSDDASVDLPLQSVQMQNAGNRILASRTSVEDLATTDHVDPNTAVYLTTDRAGNVVTSLHEHSSMLRYLEGISPRSPLTGQPISRADVRRAHPDAVRGVLAELASQQ